jgi:hypothetical protein
MPTSGADARTGAAGIYDPAGNRLLVFGGQQSGSMRNDLRALTLPGEEPLTCGTAPGRQEPWITIDDGAGVAPSPRFDPVAVYDAAGRRFVIHGGLGGPTGHALLGDTWAFSLDRGRWEMLDDGSGVCPAPRRQHVGVLDSDQNHLVIFGGQDLLTQYADVWVFDLSGLIWTQVESGLGDRGPGKRAGVAGAFRPAGGQLVIWGGAADTILASSVWSMDVGGATPGGKGESTGSDEVVASSPNVWPNPAQEAVALSALLREPGPVTVGIYDATGRLVKTVISARMPAGLSVFSWNTRDFRGEPVASGVYFCRIATPRSTWSRPIIIAR